MITLTTKENDFTMHFFMKEAKNYILKEASSGMISFPVSISDIVRLALSDFENDLTYASEEEQAEFLDELLNIDTRHIQLIHEPTGLELHFRPYENKWILLDPRKQRKISFEGIIELLLGDDLIIGKKTTENELQTLVRAVIKKKLI